MSELMPIKAIGYSKEAALYGHGNQHVVDMETLGRLMYPEAKDHAKLVRKIYERNKQHFTDKDTVLLKVDTAYFWSPNKGDMERHNDAPCGQNQGTLRHQSDDSMSSPKVATKKREMRFFTLPYGVMIICKFSDSPKSIDVLKSLLDMNEAFIRGTLPRWDRGIAPIAQMPKWTRGRGKLIEQEAEAAGVSGMSIRRHAQKMLEGKPITKNCPGMKRGYCHKKYRDIKDEAIALRQQGVSVKDIAKRLNVPQPTIYRWVIII